MPNIIWHARKFLFLSTSFNFWCCRLIFLVNKIHLIDFCPVVFSGGPSFGLFDALFASTHDSTKNTNRNSNTKFIYIMNPASRHSSYSLGGSNEEHRIEFVCQISIRHTAHERMNFERYGCSITALCLYMLVCVHDYRFRRMWSQHLLNSNDVWYMNAVSNEAHTHARTLPPHCQCLKLQQCEPISSGIKKYVFLSAMTTTTKNLYTGFSSIALNGIICCLDRIPWMCCGMTKKNAIIFSSKN